MTTGSLTRPDPATGVASVGGRCVKAPVLQLNKVPSERSGYRADIQGLRALAVLLVVVFHAGLPVSGGFVGVDVFFVISGFVIAAMLLRELEQNGRVNLVQFYSRRVRRLLPALSVMVCAVALGAMFLLSPFGTQQIVAKTGVASSLFVANALLFGVADYFAPVASTNPLLHTWSLAVEEQFYLIFPAFLFLAWLFGRRIVPRWSPRVVVGLMLAAGAFISFGLSVWMTPVQQQFAFYSSPTRAWEFAFGALLAIIAPLFAKLSRGLAVTLGVMGFGLIVIAAWTITEEVAFPGVIALLPVVGTGLILIAGTVTREGVSSVLSVRPAVWIGDISYGWYLWHWPAIVGARKLWSSSWVLTIVAVASLVPAYLSYRLLENPIRLNPRITGRRVLCLGVTCVVVPILACIGLQVGVGPAMLDTAIVKNIRQQSQLHADVARGCDNSTPIQERKSLKCSWDVANSKGRVVLVGDSNAGHFTEAIARAANREGFSFTVATFSGCPFVDLTIEYSLNNYDSEACRRFVTESVVGLTQLRPSLVMIASSSTYYMSDWKGDLRTPSDKIVPDSPGKARLWTQGLGSVVRTLSQADIPTMVIHTVPHFTDFDLRSCPAILLHRAEEQCSRSLLRQNVEAQQRLARTAEERAIAGVAQATGVDLTGDLCGDDVCETNLGDRWLYRDGTHLSVGGALGLSHRFADLIRGHAVSRST
jgi:peptidoglycan/LPS O-acetylase OafA/YrhL